jgi:hypothetical protein
VSREGQAGTTVSQVGESPRPGHLDAREMEGSCVHTFKRAAFFNMTSRLHLVQSEACKCLDLLPFVENFWHGRGVPVQNNPILTWYSAW